MNKEDGYITKAEYIRRMQWNDDVLSVTDAIKSEMTGKLEEIILDHFDMDFTDLREYLRDKEEWKRKQEAALPRWIPVTDDNLPDEGEEVLVYDGCYRVGKIEKGISVNERERMKRGEIPDPEEWGWNVAEGYFRVRRSEAHRACDEQWNNEKPYCWRVDNGHGRLFGQDVKYWMPLFKPQKEKTVNEITPEMIEAAERNEKRIKERADRIYDELIAEKRAEIERLKAEIAKMPPLDYDKLADNPPEYPVCIGDK